MKAKLFDSSGAKKSDVEMPALFNSPIREDIAAKYFEAEKSVQPYSNFEEAGKRHSASGKIARRRHKWQGGYGRGASRVPRKRMWRRGTQFYWVGAEVSSTRGGRRAHPPKLDKRVKKINKNEMTMAMNSAFAATANKEYVLKRYSTLKTLESAPWVIESLPNKTKETLSLLKKIFGDMFNLILQHKEIRAGRGKTRGRKYKSNAGLLLVIGKDEKARLTGVEVRTADEVEIADLYPLGRITLYTKKALAELGANKK